MYSSPSFDRVKHLIFNPVSGSWAILTGLWLLMLMLFFTNHELSQNFESTKQDLLRIEARLESLSSYDLESLPASSLRLSQLGKMSSIQNQPLKFVSEATTEGKRLKEIPYSMPSPVVVSGSSLLHILDILHPSKQSAPPIDIWVKYLKLRKDKENFSLQMSLVQRELKP